MVVDDGEVGVVGQLVPADVLRQQLRQRRSVEAGMLFVVVLKVGQGQQAGDAESRVHRAERPRRVHDADVLPRIPILVRARFAGANDPQHGFAAQVESLESDAPLLDERH